MTPTSASDTVADDATWQPPGPGSWQRDTSHSHAAPTRFFRRIASEYTSITYGKVMDEWGGAIKTIDFAVVNGDLYRRLVPLVGADRDNGKIPPKPILWLATRLHPVFRERNRLARKVLAERPYLDVIEGWTTERLTWIERNRALSQPDPAELSDDELAAHLDRLGEHAIAGWCRHHELHGADLGPIGDLLHHTDTWGLPDVEVMHLLKGASPATVDAARHATRIADALRAGGVDPASVGDIDAIRSIPDAAEALDAYLDEFGWRLITGYDIEDKTLVELPSAICAIVRAAAAGEAMPNTSVDTEHEARLRRRHPTQNCSINSCATPEPPMARGTTTDRSRGSGRSGSCAAPISPPATGSPPTAASPTRRTCSSSTSTNWQPSSAANPCRARSRSERATATGNAPSPARRPSAPNRMANRTSRRSRPRSVGSWASSRPRSPSSTSTPTRSNAPCTDSGSAMPPTPASRA